MANEVSSSPPAASTPQGAAWADTLVRVPSVVTLVGVATQFLLAVFGQGLLAELSRSSNAWFGTLHVLSGTVIGWLTSRLLGSAPGASTSAAARVSVSDE